MPATVHCTDCTVDVLNNHEHCATNVLKASDTADLL